MRKSFRFVSLLRLLIAAALVIPAPLSAQSDPVDKFILAQLKSQNIPGLSLVVTKNGEIVKAKGYGFANLKDKIPATPETIYRIASVSKQFVATGIILLVQDGKVSLDDKIGKYLTDAPPMWHNITVRHLLSHTSGLVREAPGFDGIKAAGDLDLIRPAYSLPLRFTPGEKFDYGNLGYNISAQIITKVSGQPWTEYLREKIFKPADMTMTHPTNTTLTLPNRATGYQDNDNLLVVSEWTTLRPSGGFLSNVLDLAKWDAVLNTDRVLSASTRQKMWTPVKLNDGSEAPYGLGWKIDRVHGRRRIHHSGGMPGYRGEFSRFVDDGVSVIVLMNLDDVDVETIVSGVARFYLP
jgi:CubicO group peptidase (beta-lactamase class C family)